MHVQNVTPSSKSSVPSPPICRIITTSDLGPIVGAGFNSIVYEDAKDPTYLIKVITKNLKTYIRPLKLIRLIGIMDVGKHWCSFIEASNV